MRLGICLFYSQRMLLVLGTATLGFFHRSVFQKNKEITWIEETRIMKKRNTILYRTENTDAEKRNH